MLTKEELLYTFFKFSGNIFYFVAYTDIHITAKNGTMCFLLFCSKKIFIRLAMSLRFSISLINAMGMYGCLPPPRDDPPDLLQ